MFLNKNIFDDEQSQSDLQSNQDNSVQNNMTDSKGLVKRRVTLIEQQINKSPQKSFTMSSSKVKEQDNTDLVFFQDEDDDDDDIQEYQQPLRQQPTVRQQTTEKSQQVLKIQTQQRFSDKYNGGGYQNDNLIDMEKIAQSVQDQGGFYEPGQFKYTIDSDLPQLQRLGTGNTATTQLHLSHNNGQSMQVGTQVIMKQIGQEEQKNQTIEVKEEIDSDEDVDGCKVNPNMVEPNQQTDEMIQQRGSELQEQITNNISKQIDGEQKETKTETVKEEQKQEQPQIVQQPLIKTLPYPKPLDPISIVDMKNFLTSPAPRGGMIQCTIKRDKSGMGRFYPKYQMHLSSGYRYLMSAKKRPINNTSNYLVGMDRNNLDKKSQGFLGKVRSNFLGTEFMMFDRGENPKKVKDQSKARQELGAVLYESNLLGSKGPRKMKILLPIVDETNNQVYEYRPRSSKEGMLIDYKLGLADKVKSYVNRQPKWNDMVQAFVLNFYGRVDKPSVKNFQLVEVNSEENIFLQFGRIGEEIFNLDFQWPLSPLQAFEIALTSFDYKIACE